MSEARLMKRKTNMDSVLQRIEEEQKEDSEFNAYIMRNDTLDTAVSK